MAIPAAVAIAALSMVIQGMLPAAKGPFAVGMLDWNRSVARSARNEADFCNLQTRLWYPAAPAETKRSLRYDPSASKLSMRYWATIDAQAGASPSAAMPMFPVIIFFPGWVGGLNENVALVQDLASRGFVVVAVGYESQSCAGLAPGDGMELDLTTAERFSRTRVIAQTRLDRVSRAASQVVDDLIELNLSDPSGRFKGRVDLSRLAAAGHSFGGAVAVAFSAHDARVTAVADIDGWLFDAGADGWISQPLLYISDGGTPATPADLQSSNLGRRHAAMLELATEARIANAVAAGRTMRVILDGTEHDDFADFRYLGWRALFRLGSGEREAIRRATDRIAAFLADVWSGERSPFLDRRSTGVHAVGPQPANASTDRTRAWP